VVGPLGRGGKGGKRGSLKEPQRVGRVKLKGQSWIQMEGRNRNLVPLRAYGNNDGGMREDVRGACEGVECLSWRGIVGILKEGKEKSQLCKDEQESKEASLEGWGCTLGGSVCRLRTVFFRLEELNSKRASGDGGPLLLFRFFCRMEQQGNEGKKNWGATSDRVIRTKLMGKKGRRSIRSRVARENKGRNQQESPREEKGKNWGEGNKERKIAISKISSTRRRAPLYRHGGMKGEKGKKQVPTENTGSHKGGKVAPNRKEKKTREDIDGQTSTLDLLQIFPTTK